MEKEKRMEVTTNIRITLMLQNINKKNYNKKALLERIEKELGKDIKECIEGIKRE